MGFQSGGGGVSTSPGAVGVGVTDPSSPGGLPSRSSSADTGDLPSRHVVPPARQLLGHILPHRRRDQDLFGTGDQARQPAPPLLSSSAKTSSSTSTGSPPSLHSRSYAASRRASAIRPGLAVARVPLRRELARASRTRSSRCGPTSDTPRRAPASRRSHAGRRPPRAASRGRRGPRRPELAATTAVVDPGHRSWVGDTSAYAFATSGCEASTSRRAGRPAARRRAGRGGRPRRRAWRTSPCARRTPAAGGLEQGVALLEHPVVVLADAGQPRRPRDQQFVEEPPPLGGVALDQGEVLRREQHRPQDAEHVAGRGAARG